MSSGAGALGRHHWRFEDNRDEPITNDASGVTILLRHMKSPGCSIPAMRNMVEKDAYVDTSAAVRQMVAAINRMVASYEQRLKDAPRADELESVKKVVQDFTTVLQNVQKKNVEQEESIRDQGSYIWELDISERALKDELWLAKNEIENLREYKLTSKDEIRHLKDLLAKMTTDRSSDIKLVVRTGKRELAAKYQAALAATKEKFIKKGIEVDSLIKVQEVGANLELLDLIIKKEIVDLEGEVVTLKGQEVQFETELAAA